MMCGRVGTGIVFGTLLLPGSITQVLLVVRDRGIVSAVGADQDGHGVHLQ